MSAQLPDECEAARELLALAGMVNQAVGDALSGLLLVEAALRRRGWGLAEWGALYDDLPSRQLKARGAASGLGVGETLRDMPTRPRASSRCLPK